MKKLLTITMTMALAAATLAAQELVPAPAPEIASAMAPQAPPPPPPPRIANLRVPLESKAVKGAPYSAQMEIESIQTLSDGNRIVHRTAGRVYRDSAGRIRREEDQPSGQPTILIFDPEAGVSYSLDVEKRVAWKTSAPATTEILKKLETDLQAQAELFKKMAVERQAADAKQAESAKAREGERGAQATDDVQRRREEDMRKVEAAAAAAKAAAGGFGPGGRGTIAIARTGRGGGKEQVSEEVLSARTIEGVRADGTRRTVTIPAGDIGNELPIKIVSEEWQSPELQVLVMTQHSDPRIGQSSYRLLNIARTEPNPTLFQVPSDYTIRETGIRRFEKR